MVINGIFPPFAGDTSSQSPILIFLRNQSLHIYIDFFRRIGQLPHPIPSQLGADPKPHNGGHNRITNLTKGSMKVSYVIFSCSLEVWLLVVGKSGLFLEKNH